ncbi:MAG: hypothetical protein ACI9O6_002432 [Glaciecola sp.]
MLEINVFGQLAVSIMIQLSLPFLMVFLSLGTVGAELVDVHALDEKILCCSSKSVDIYTQETK